MAYFFTSDEHIGHRNIIKLCKRPFDNLEHMEKELITRHNSRVSKGDMVFHLGDMFWRTYGYIPAQRYVEALNGAHYYIYGNHEELFERHLSLRKLFDIYVESHRVKVEDVGAGHGIHLSHFAHRVWPRSGGGSWHLYGHSHSELPEDLSLSFDIGVDAWDYYPVSLEEVKAKMYRKLEWWEYLDKVREQIDLGGPHEDSNTTEPPPSTGLC